jgi:hypothetical protein
VNSNTPTDLTDLLDDLLRLGTTRQTDARLEQELQRQKLMHRMRRTIARGAIATNGHRSLRQQMKG